MISKNSNYATRPDGRSNKRRLENLLVKRRILISTNADSEKKFTTAMARDVPISPLIPPEEW
jgi:hypothetical protein